MALLALMAGAVFCTIGVMGGSVVYGGGGVALLVLAWFLRPKQGPTTTERPKAESPPELVRMQWYGAVLVILSPLVFAGSRVLMVLYATSNMFGKPGQGREEAQMILYGGTGGALLFLVLGIYLSVTANLRIKKIQS